jgi:hypothetical protein
MSLLVGLVDYLYNSKTMLVLGWIWFSLLFMAFIMELTTLFFG